MDENGKTGLNKRLFLRFHSRVIGHLGIQMYQSPVNVIAELVANAWDADATRVEIDLPRTVANPDAAFTICDDGIGMSFDECQNLYLAVGRDRRGGDAEERTPKGRSVLGRKGIGKFAGFGIASLVTVETTSALTGERTVFRLDLDALAADDEPGDVQKEIDVVRCDPPSEEGKGDHGTSITLSNLTIQRAPSRDRFSISMARRFLLHEEQTDFAVSIQGKPLPRSYDEAGFEYQFPRDFPDPVEEVEVDGDGWGVETVAGKQIRWRLLFRKNTIDEEELRGVTVYAGGKLAQGPFFFNLTRGLTGQHGTEYLTGQVVADFIDRLPADLIATERQRVNWDRAETAPLLEWGRRRLRHALRAWTQLRAEKKARRLEEKIAEFSDRLQRLPGRERKTVTRALTSLGAIPTLSEQQFDDLGNAVLNAWEKGRLHGLIDDISEAKGLDGPKLLEILLEARALTALQTLEVVRTKLATVQGLGSLIKEGRLENDVRDFVAENPWLVSPEWETFRKETSLRRVTMEAAAKAKLSTDVYRGRVDLAMASGRHLLILEFVRPGQAVDWDHLSRFERYVLSIRGRVKTATGGRFQNVTGHIISDKLDSKPEFVDKIQMLHREDMYAMSWSDLLEEAEARWIDFLDVLGVRGGDDFRVKSHLDAVRRRDLEGD